MKSSHKKAISKCVLFFFIIQLFVPLVAHWSTWEVREYSEIEETVSWTGSESTLVSNELKNIVEEISSEFETSSTWTTTLPIQNVLTWSGNENIKEIEAIEEVNVEKEGTWSTTEITEDAVIQQDSLDIDSIIEVENAGELIKYYISWDISSNLNTDNTTNNALFNRAVKFIDSTGLEATLFAGTHVFTKNGDSFDLMALELVQNPGDSVDLDDYETLAGSTKFGIQWQDLVFSKPVKLKIPVLWVLDGEFVSLQVKHASDSEYNDFGLTDNPSANCWIDGSVSEPYAKSQVRDGYASIYTCGASNFNAVYIGGANVANFVDNGSITKTTTITTSDVPIGATVQDVIVIVDFESIDGTDPTNPLAANAYSSEISYTITSPEWTVVNLVNVETYTNDNPAVWRVQATFDDASVTVVSGVPSTGTFQPAWSLATLDGESPFGDWILTISDSVNDDGAILHGFTVQLSANGAPTDIVLTSEDIDEQQVSGTTVGTLSTIDPDVWDTHTYSLTCASAGIDDSSFTISGTDLSSTEVFDFNIKSSYDICIRVSDGAATYDEDFTISINSWSVPAPVINNNLPIITSTGTSFSVASWVTTITTITSTDSDTSNVVMQYGTANVTWSAWSTINHSQMCSPVVVASSRNDVNGLNQSVVRVDNKATWSFDIKVDNQANSIPGAQVTQVDWIVTNSGANTFVDDNDDDFQMQAGSQLTSQLYAKACRTSATPQNTTFNPVFSAPPAVLHSISSNNWPVSVASTVNANNNNYNSEPTASQIWFQLNKALWLCTAVPAENIDYIAMDRWHYIFGGDEVDILKSWNTVRSVSAAWNTVSYSSAFSSIPQTILVALSDWNGSDGWHANIHSQGVVTATDFPATIDEDDNIAGTSRTHANEVIAWAAFAKNNGVITQPNILSYSISGGGDAAFFQISSTGWELSFVNWQDGNIQNDFNVDGTYEVEVQVCDNHCSVWCDTQIISVSVNWAPTNIALSGTWVDEWVSAGSTIWNFSTTDVNSGDTHSYSFVSGAWDTDNAAFTISGSTLTINNSPVFATQSSYDIRVQSDDWNGWIYNETFTILVTDIDNEVPNITITAPTKLNNASIIDTTIKITDNFGITAANISVSGTSTAVNSSLNCTQSWALEVNCTISIDDSGNLVIAATDDASNSTSDTELGYFIDTVPPNIPSVSVDTEFPASVDTPEITFSALDNLAVDRFTISYNSNNGTWGIWTWVILDPATSPVILTLDPDEAVHTIIVTVFDTAGNSASSTVVFPPNVTFSAPTTISESTITDSTFTVNNPSGNDVSNIILSANTTGASLGTCTWSGSDTTAPYNNPVVCVINNIATSGTITVSGDDSALWATGMNSQSYIIDTTAPIVTITAPTISSWSSITNTTIRVTDTVWVFAANVVIGSGSTTTSGYSCTQTNVSQVDCNISIDATGDLVVNATDSAGNLWTETQTGYVVDVIAPVITLNGSWVIAISQWSGLIDPGATCSDNIDLTCNVTVSWSVDTFISGVYTISYNAVDVAWNIASTITRTVYVTGAAILINEVEYDPTWLESEAEWFELYNPTGSSVNISGWTITEWVGNSYTFLSWVTIPAGWYLVAVNDTTNFSLTYSWSLIDVDMDDTDSPSCFNDTECLRLSNSGDSLTLSDAVSTGAIDFVEWETGIWSGISGTAGASICRTGVIDTNLPADWSAECTSTPWNLNIVDNTPAIITLVWSWIVTIEVGSLYTDLWATYNDDKDGIGSITASGTVNTSNTGTFILSYDYTDNAWNISTQVTRTVNVVDTTIPAITLVGSWVITFVKNSVFIDPGATASDNLDGNISWDIIVNGTVDTSWLWLYTLTYDVTDTSWNSAVQVTRSVNVVTGDIPVLSLIWSGTVSAELGSVYSDLWATYSDSEDGTGTVIWTWNIDINTLWTYSFTYNFTDSSDNTATQITRSINVVDTTPPVIPTITSPTPGQLLTNNTPTLTGTGEADSIFEVRNGWGVLLWTGRVNVSGNYSFAVNPALPEWDNTLSVNLIDDSGNSWLSSSVIFSVDTLLPVVTIMAPTKLSNASIVDTTIRITDNIWLNAGDISVWTWSSATMSSFNCTQSWALEVNCSISVDDSWTLIIFASDTSGNTSSDTEIWYVIDTVAPNVPSISVNTDFPFSVDDPQVTFSALDNVAVDKFTLTYNVDDNAATTIWASTTLDPATSPIVLDLDPDELLHSIVVTVFDLAGNSTSSTIQFPPSVTFNAPTTLSGWVISDSSVTINNPSGNDISNISLTANTTNATLWACTGSGSDITAPYATPVTCIINNITGSGTIIVSWDDASIGATGMNSQSYIIDNTPAVITITAPTKLSNTGVTNTTIEVIDNAWVTTGNVVIGWSTTTTVSNYSCSQINSSTVSCSIQIDDSGNLQITVTDDAGNSSSQEENNYVIDVTPAVITLNGSGALVLEVWDSYSDAWAVFNDNIDGTGWLVATGWPISTSGTGVFILSYDYTDTAWNISTTLTRTVNVLDTTPPVISLTGSWFVSILRNTLYVDLWASYTDNLDIPWVLTASWMVDITTVWIYTLIYDLTDNSWNAWAQVIRTVQVVAWNLPEILFSGSGTIESEFGLPFVDPGVTGKDIEDGDITGSLISSWTVDTNTLGTYTIDYTLQDSSLNQAAPRTRTVNVVDTTPASLSLNGSGSITLEFWTPYVDLWASYSDLFDGTWSLIASGSVDVNTLWTYILSYDYTDTNGNISTGLTRTIYVVDTTLPVITLNGSGSITVEAWSSYSDAWAIFNDNVDGTGSIVGTGIVNTNAPWVYSLDFDYTDTSWNIATQVVRTIDVVDTTPAVISLNGSWSITLEIGDSYTDAWAVFTDIVDGTWSIIATGWPVVTSSTGSFTLSYDYTDSEWNISSTVTRVVSVVDTTNPVLTLSGSGIITVEAGSVYVDAWATFSDNLDGTWSVTASWVVDTTSTGSTTLTYDYTDISWNVATQITRTVNVVDTTPAVILLNGSSVITLEIGDSYSDAGAQFSDVIDGTGAIVATGGPVTTSSTGSFMLSYDYTDSSGNITATVNRTINVVDTTPPVITLVGSGLITQEQNTVYTDSWAIALDNLDGNITANIVTVNPVNTANTGSYTVTYNLLDASWNSAAQITRVVNVVTSLFDGDGDGVPDIIEVQQGTDPGDIWDFRDTDGNWDPDFTDPDNDGDGSLDIIELAAPNSWDFNGDGLPDIDQRNVATIISPVTTNYVSLDTTTWANCGSNAFTMRNESSFASQDTLLYQLGFADFELECALTGATTNIKVYFDRSYDTSLWTYKKYNETLDAYTDISSIVTYTTENRAGTNITVANYSVTDGWVNDEDGIANRTILDPSGPGIIPPEPIGWWRTYSCRDPEASNYRTYGFSDPDLCEYLEDNDSVSVSPEDSSEQDVINQEDTPVDETPTAENVLVKDDDYTLENDFNSCPIIDDIQNPNYIYSRDVYWDTALSRYESEIYKFSQIGIVNGYDDGTFGPESEMTRTEFLKVALISHCYEYSTEDVSNLDYIDVDRLSWQARVISKAESLDMINGDRDEAWNKIFRPNDIISKAEATKILMKLSQITVQNPTGLWYTDIETSWQRKYVITWESLWIFNSEQDNGRFYPNLWVKREEMIDLTNRLIKLYN